MTVVAEALRDAGRQRRPALRAVASSLNGRPMAMVARAARREYKLAMAPRPTDPDQINLPGVRRRGRPRCSIATKSALVANDVEVLIELFWDDPRTVRYGIDEEHVGHADIGAYRRTQAVATPPRRLRNTVITTFGTDVATADTEFVPDGSEAARTTVPDVDPHRGGLACRERARVLARGPTPLSQDTAAVGRRRSTRRRIPIRRRGRDRVLRCPVPSAGGG